MESIEGLVAKFLAAYDLKGEDFDGTPARVAKLWGKFFEYEDVKMVHFPTDIDGGIIAVKDYCFWSFCPHHLLPVKYVATIAYVPNGRAFGLSKLGRAAMKVAKKLPLQEDVARLIAKELYIINPKGIAVKVTGEHLCMQMRGIKDPCVHAVSDYFYGCMALPVWMERFNNL